ncbi:hypothetical protein N9L86_05765, partial [Euryarchaeota archaeon]|nr:hypothetical protein [Euryarchaeota archaeon]
SLGWTPEIVFDDDSITQSKSIDSKVNSLLTWIKEHLMNGSTWNGERVLIFTHYDISPASFSKWVGKNQQLAFLWVDLLKRNDHSSRQDLMIPLQKLGF